MRAPAGGAGAPRAGGGNVHLKTALVTAAIGASRRKGSYYKDKYHRLKARRGRLRAAVAIAHKILVAAYHMLAGGVPFRELGEAFLDRQARQRNVRQLLRRLNHLGYDVLLQPRRRDPSGPIFGAVDVLVSQGQSVADAVRSIGVTEVTYYRWRQEYGGLKTEQIKRLKELETENARLRRAVAELTLDKQILKEAALGNY